MNATKCLAVAVLLATCADANGLPRDGDYFNTVFLAKLLKTKSLHKSWSGLAPQTVTVSRDKRRFILGLNWNWHEGDQALFDGQNPTVPIGADSSEEVFHAVDATHFRFKDTDRAFTYRYIGDSLQFLTDLLLTGTYADARGRRYVFGADGKAHFPDKAFRYELYTDMVFEGSDEFTNLDATKPNNPVNIGFEWKRNRLYLYDLDCPETSPGCKPVKAKPLAVLHRVKT